MGDSQATCGTATANTSAERGRPPKIYGCDWTGNTYESGMYVLGLQHPLGMLRWPVANLDLITLLGPSSTMVLTIPAPVSERFKRGLGSEGPNKRAA